MGEAVDTIPSILNKCRQTDTQTQIYYYIIPRTFKVAGYKKKGIRLILIVR